MWRPIRCRVATRPRPGRVLVEVQADGLGATVRVTQAEVRVDLHGQPAEHAEGVAGRGDSTCDGSPSDSR